MNKSFLAGFTVATLLTNIHGLDYKAVPDWQKLPQGREKLGNMHGDVGVSSKGEVYVSVMDPNAGLQVFSPDGKFARNVPDAPSDFHGFIIRKEKDGEFIYGPRLTGQTIVKMTLDGKFLGVIATDMLLPAAVALHGDYAAIGEIKGQVTVLDKAGQVVAKFGTNTEASEVGTNKTEPAKWRPGIVTAPHGVAFNERGDLFVSEYNIFGRVHRFDRQ